MICVYPPNCTDFSTNGLGVVTPQKCTVTETLNGQFELMLEHDIDEFGKWDRLHEENIIVAPVPASPTPRVALVHQNISSYTNEVYKIIRVNNDYPLRLRSGPGTDYSIIGHYDIGSEIIKLSQDGEWFEVTCPDGAHGWMLSLHLELVRQEVISNSSDPYETGAVVESRLLRPQPFRIYRVVPTLSGITVYARHIFYDLMDNMVGEYKPVVEESGASVAENLLSRCYERTNFKMYSNLKTTADDADYSNANPVSAMMDEGGMTEKYKAEFFRDWYDIFAVDRVGHDKDITIRNGKNMRGITYDLDITNVVTRIVPTGEDADGNVLYLPEHHIDSKHIKEYAHVKWYHLDVSEASVSDDMTQDQAFEKMREAVRKEYENGCDEPAGTLTVDFVNCANTEEYKQYKHLQNLYIGDSVRVIASKIGIEVSMRVTEYTYNCLTQKYDLLALGTVAAGVGDSQIASKQLGNGIVTVGKLAYGVGSVINISHNKAIVNKVTGTQLESAITQDEKNWTAVFNQIGMAGKQTGIVQAGADGIIVQHTDVKTESRLGADGLRMYDKAGKQIGGTYALTDGTVVSGVQMLCNPMRGQFRVYVAPGLFEAEEDGMTFYYGDANCGYLSASVWGDGSVGGLVLHSNGSLRIEDKNRAIDIEDLRRIYYSTTDPGGEDGDVWFKPI